LVTQRTERSLAADPAPRGEAASQAAAGTTHSSDEHMADDERQREIERVDESIAIGRGDAATSTDDADGVREAVEATQATVRSALDRIRESREILADSLKPIEEMLDDLRAPRSRGGEEEAAAAAGAATDDAERASPSPPSRPLPSDDAPASP
jgi:hypothetical protein